MSHTPRPPLSPRELAAYERLLSNDVEAADALCFPAPEKTAARERAETALAAARAVDAAHDNFYARRFAAWLARQPVACGRQVA